MKYEYRVIEIKDLKEGDTIDIPEGSLILRETTTPEQRYIYDPDKPDYTTTIKILSPKKIEQ